MRRRNLPECRRCEGGAAPAPHGQPMTKLSGDERLALEAAYERLWKVAEQHHKLEAELDEVTSLHWEAWKEVERLKARQAAPAPTPGP